MSDQRKKRAARKALEAENKKWPCGFVEIPRDQWPEDLDPKRLAVLRHRKYLVQLFWEGTGMRMSVNRTSVLPNGRWDDGITWDELQKIKSDLGYGDKWAIEIYPPDEHVVNVANMRHLWILDEPPAAGWRRA